MLIRDVMTVPAVTVTTETPIDAAVRLMHEEQLTSIPVVNDRGALDGLICADDVVRPGAARCARDVETHRGVAVRADDEIETAIALMRSTAVTNLPVLAGDHVVGNVSQSDLDDLLTDYHVHTCDAAGTACGPHLRERRTAAR